MGLNDNFRYNQLIKSVEEQRLAKSYRHLDWLQKNCDILATKGFHEQIVSKYVYDRTYIRQLLDSISSGPNKKLQKLSAPALLYLKSRESKEEKVRESLVFQSFEILKTAPIEGLAAHYFLLQVADLKSPEQKLKLLLKTEQEVQNQITMARELRLDAREYELQLTLAKCYELLFYSTKEETMANLAIQALDDAGSSFIASKQSTLLSDDGFGRMDPEEFKERLLNRKSSISRAD